MVDYVELLIGEVLLGDTDNAYLYVGEDRTAQQIVMGSFIRRVMEEGQQLTSVLSPIGKIIVNGTQRFCFVHKEQDENMIKGLSFNRIFIEEAHPVHRDIIKRSMLLHLVPADGDFV